jgi:hypothetical protein
MQQLIQKRVHFLVQAKQFDSNFKADIKYCEDSLPSLDFVIISQTIQDKSTGEGAGKNHIICIARAYGYGNH